MSRAPESQPKRVYALAVAVAALAAATLSPTPASASSGTGHNPHGRVLGVAHARGGKPALRAARRAGPVTVESPLAYHGGPVVHDGHVYAIFWEPPGNPFPADYKAAVAKYFSDVAADSGKHTNVYSTSRQYTDSSGPAAYRVAFAGSYTDTSPLPASGCSDPQTVGSCYQNPGSDPECAFDVFCAYHSWFGSSGTTLYAIQPFVKDTPSCDTGESPTGTSADGVLNLVSHEHNEIITDPTGDGWYDQNGEENGDKCAWEFGSLQGAVDHAFNQVIAGSSYLLQREWSNADSGCASSYGANQAPVVAFQRVGAAVAKKPVHFSARASRDPDGSIRSYSWRFGDGRTGVGVAPAHTYAARGTYRVQLKVTDNEGSTAVRTLGIVVQPPPHRPRAAGGKKKHHRRKHRRPPAQSGSSASRFHTALSWR